nr:hypothetical protein [Pandoravirus belohorizontensis]
MHQAQRRRTMHTEDADVVNTRRDRRHRSLSPDRGFEDQVAPAHRRKRSPERQQRCDPPTARHRRSPAPSRSPSPARDSTDERRCAKRPRYAERDLSPSARHCVERDDDPIHVPCVDADDDASDSEGIKDSHSEEEDDDDRAAANGGTRRADIIIASEAHTVDARIRALAGYTVAAAPRRRLTGNARTRLRREQRERRAVLQALAIIKAEQDSVGRTGSVATNVKSGERSNNRRNSDRGVVAAVPYRQREEPSPPPRGRDRCRPDRPTDEAESRCHAGPSRSSIRITHRERVSLMDAVSRLDAYHEVCRRAFKDSVPPPLPPPEHYFNLVHDAVQAYLSLGGDAGNHTR